MLTKEEIEGNVLIGEYINRFDDYKAYNRSHGLPEYNPYEDTVEIESLRYHSSIDLLLPVIQKILKDHVVVIASQNDTEHHCMIGIGAIRVISESMAKAVWLAVVEYLKTLNNNPKTIIQCSLKQK